MKTYVLIPARGGSRGIFRKNIAPLFGKPLIAWTIEQALQINEIDRVIVSTEDSEIAEIARQYGAETPFVRPAELASDTANGMDVLVHCARWLQEEEAYQADYLFELPVTTPLRTDEDILATLEVARTYSADIVVGVTPVAEHPYWVRRIDENHRLQPFIADTPAIARRQDLPDACALNGAVYMIRVDTLLNHDAKSDKTYPVVMPRDNSIDINTPFDLRLAEFMLQQRDNAD
ncbi:MAG: cytidylyltransferase domain-containing protein [Aggregatilineales bacterium]